MAQLTCPHCKGAFQLDLSIPTAEFACPHCGGAVPSPSAPPSMAITSPAQTAPAPIATEAEAPVVLKPLIPDEPPVTESPPVLLAAAPPPEPVAAPPEIPVLHAAPIPHDAPDAYSASHPDTHALDSKLLTDETQWNERTLRHYASEERSSRRFVKNFIVWLLCAIILIVLMTIFLGK